jgi:hypothetical protein
MGIAKVLREMAEGNGCTRATDTGRCLGHAAPGVPFCLGCLSRPEIAAWLEGIRSAAFRAGQDSMRSVCRQASVAFGGPGAGRRARPTCPFTTTSLTVTPVSGAEPPKPLTLPGRPANLCGYDLHEGVGVHAQVRSTRLYDAAAGLIWWRAS